MRKCLCLTQHVVNQAGTCMQMPVGTEGELVLADGTCLWHEMKAASSCVAATYNCRARDLTAMTMLRTMHLPVQQF